MSGKKVAYAYFTSVLGVISGLVTNLWIIREFTTFVSATEFGLYSYVFQISAYLSILQIGLDFSASRSIAKYIGLSNEKKAAEVFNALKKYNNKVTLAVVCISALIALYLSYSQASESALTLRLFVLAAAVQIIYFIQRPLTSVLIGSGYQSTVNLLNVTRSLVNSLLSFGLLVIGLGVYSILAAEVCTVLLSTLVLLYYVRRKVEWFKLAAANPSTDSISKEIFNFGIWASLGGFAWTIEATSDVIIVEQVLGVGVVGIYVIWWRFPQMLFDFCTRLGSSAFPFFSKHAHSEDGNLQPFFDKVFIAVSGLAGLVFTVIIVTLPSFIHLWMEGKFWPQEINIQLFVILIGFLVFFRIIGNLLGMFVLAMGQAPFSSKLGWAQALFKIIAGVVFVIYAGLPGLIFASVLTSIIQVLFYAYYIVKKKFVKLLDKLNVLLLSAFLPLLSILLGDYPITQWLQLLVLLLVVCTTYILVFTTALYFTRYRVIILSFARVLRNKKLI